MQSSPDIDPAADDEERSEQDEEREVFFTRMFHRFESVMSEGEEIADHGKSE